MYVFWNGYIFGNGCILIEYYDYQYMNESDLVIFLVLMYEFYYHYMNELYYY